MATTTAAAAVIASPTVPSRRKGGSKRPADDVDKDASATVKRVKNDGETSPGHIHDGAALAEDQEEVAGAVERSNGTAASKAGSLLGWPVEELNQLVKNLERCLPANDLVKYTTMVEKVDWEKVRFSTYSAAQCKEKWMQLMQKLRRYRTLTDIVADAYTWLQQPGGCGTARRGRNPALPKKPLTPYFRYFLEKRAKYARENPELSMTQLAKLLSTKYQQLSDKKKQKYKDSFEKDNAVYKAELKKFKKEHPDEFPEPGSKQTPADGAPGKPQTPFQMFAAERLKRPDLANLDKKEAQEEIRRQWTNLSDGKRLKWIRRALQGQHRYEEEVAEYTQAFPGFKAANTKPVLSKAEQEFKDKCEGKPERPPNSGYSLFSRIMLRQLKNVPAKEKMTEISRLWRGLSQSERDSYNKQATKANAKYKEKYAAYLSNLPDEQRLKLESDAAVPKGSAGGNAAVKKAAAAAALSTSQQNGTTGGGGDENQPPKSERPKPKKPLSAMFFFQQEKVAQVREKHPDMSKQEIMRLLAREFSELPDKKKEKYQKMAAEAKQKAEEETNGCKAKEEKLSTPHPSKKQKLYKGEPKKPPQSGYGAFSTEMLSQLVDVDPKQRMSEIARRWNAMPDEDKEHYKSMVQDLQRKYTKELRKFLENLNPEDRAQYDELQARIKDQRKGGGAAAARATPKAKAKTKGKEQETPTAAPGPEKEGESSSSSSSESSSEESSDEEEEEQDEKGKQKEGGSEEESDSSSEESDSDSDSSSSSEEEAVSTVRQPAADAKKVAEAAKAEESSDSDSSEGSSEEEEDDDSSDSDSDSK